MFGIDASTFWSVFIAVSLAEFCKELYNRYAKNHLNKALDTAEGLQMKGRVREFISNKGPRKKVTSVFNWPPSE